MSGKIEFTTRKGKSLDKRYEYYEYWAWRVTGESGKVVELTPSYPHLMDVFKKIFAHEKKMDRTRDRKPDATKWGKFITNILKEARENKLISDFKK